jgi:hypothetical protein
MSFLLVSCGRKCRPAYLEGEEEEENQPALAVTKSIFLKVIAEKKHKLSSK